MPPVTRARYDLGSWRVVMLCLMLTAPGCARRSAFPQEWEVDAAHPHALEVWNRRNADSLPHDLREQYLQALKHLSRASGQKPPKPGEPLSREPGDPVCARVHGQTVREIILLGFDVRIQHLDQRIALESRNLAANISRFEEARSEAKYGQFVGYQREVIARLENARAELVAARDAFASDG